LESGFLFFSLFFKRGVTEKNFAVARAQPRKKKRESKKKESKKKEKGKKEKEAKIKEAFTGAFKKNKKIIIGD
jgi:hypothetical protein